MTPLLNPGVYVFCRVKNLDSIDMDEVLCTFKEAAATTVILKKEMADKWELPYQYIAAWISLSVHSSLEAVGLTAAFSAALTKENISCNVIAAYYHDHIFVDTNDAAKAMDVLQKMTGSK